jgi:hypothetical protein
MKLIINFHEYIKRKIGRKTLTMLVAWLLVITLKVILVLKIYAFQNSTNRHSIVQNSSQ